MLEDIRFTRPRHFGLLLASSLAVNALALALPLMTMQIYDRVLSNRAEDTLIILAGGVLVAALMEFVLRICRSVIVGRNGAAFEHVAANEALSRLLEAEPQHRAFSPSAILAQDIGASARLKDYYGGQMMVTLLVDAPFTLVFLAFAAYLSHWLAIVPLVVLGIFTLISFHQGRRLRNYMNERERQDNARYSFITQSLQVIHTVKALCLEAVTARRFEEVQRESGQLNYAIAALHGQSGSMSYGFSQVMTVAVITAGAPLAIAGHITVGTLIACVLLSGQIMQPLQRGLAMWVRFQDIALAKDRLGALLTLPRRGFLPTESLAPNHGVVKMESARFAYTAGAPVIDGANLMIEPGDTIAITGGPGSGKTTLLELLAGIVSPSKGRIELCGMDVARIPSAERTRYIAYLPMGGMILRGSIMDNLTAFNPQMRALARKVADHLGIEEAVSLLPSGYDTPLEGNATDVVPPGLKQRIAIARALLHKPRLVLFDNADHGMDHESYVHIFSLLAKLKNKATLVLVSEDRNIMSLADHVYDLRHGQLSATMMPSPHLGERKFVKGVMV